MNSAHLHLVLNHLPIILPLIGLFIMIGGLVFRSEIVKRTAFLVFILGAILAIPTVLSGGNAEEILEMISDVDEKYIKTHEELAEKFAILCYVMGGISIVGLWLNYYKKPFATMVCYVTIFVCAITLYYGKYTATTGGEIRHIEIR